MPPPKPQHQPRPLPDGAADRPMGVVAQPDRGLVPRLVRQSVWKYRSTVPRHWTRPGV